MMEMLKQWLIGITCAAMIVSLADSLTPSGTVRRIGKLAGGLVLMLAVIKPIAGIDWGTMAISMTDYKSMASAYQLELETVDSDLMKNIIGQRAGAYILDKAEAVGAVCSQVEVTCEIGEGGLPYPSAARITGELTAAQQNALSRQIEADLAIPAECQTYERVEVEE